MPAARSPAHQRQGTRATTADGTFLASNNNNNPGDSSPASCVRPLKNWDNLRAEGRKFSGEDPLDIAQLNRADLIPSSRAGLVLKVNTRDLPRNPPQRGRWADAWNQDFAWFTKDEAGSSCLAEIEPGRTREVPRPLVEATRPVSISSTTCVDRLHRSRRAIEDATLTSRVTAVDGDVVSPPPGKAGTSAEKSETGRSAAIAT